MPANHATQKKALKHKKKREAARLKSKESVRLSLRPTTGEILRLAVGRPLGPAFVSSDWDKVDEAIPRLVSVVVTRQAPGHLLLGSLALVDRTCLGVKNAILFPPQTELELDARLELVAEQIGSLVRAPPLLAQSVVFHALDYARALGFAAHPDFPEAIFGPRPALLADTPLARPARPYYVSGPQDDVARVIERLTAAVGPDGFDFLGHNEFDSDEFDELDELDESDDDEDAGELPAG